MSFFETRSEGILTMLVIVLLILLAWQFFHPTIIHEDKPVLMEKECPLCPGCAPCLQCNCQPVTIREVIHETPDCPKCDCVARGGYATNNTWWYKNETKN